MHFSNQKLSFDVFTVGNWQNIFIEHDLYLLSLWFLAFKKIDNFDPYNIFLAIATNIPVLLKTGNKSFSLFYINIEYQSSINTFPTPPHFINNLKGPQTPSKSMYLSLNI